MAREQASIIRWAGSGDEFIPVIGDDGDTSWWSGAQFAFVGVAIAGAVAALATSTAVARSFTHADEPPSLYAVGLEDDSWQPSIPRLAAPILSQQWDDQADDIVAQASIAHEDYWHTVYSVPLDPVARIWWQQDEVAQTVAPLTVDEVYWQPSPILAVPLAQQAMAADDEIVPQPPQSEDYWQRPTWIPVDPLAVIWTHQDEIARIGVDEDYWQQPYTAPAPMARPASVADVEIVPQPAPLTVDEVYWRAPFLFVTVAPVVVVFTHQDHVPTAAPPDVYTADSRGRMGSSSDRVATQRIGSAQARVGKGRIGGSRQ